MPKRFYSLDNFGKGINNVKNPRDLTVGEMAECVNWNVSKNGELIPRSEWKTATDGSALTLSSNTVPVHTASLKPGYGLFYFEADDPIGVGGGTARGNGATGNTGQGPDGNSKHTICFFDSDKIFINDDNFWTDNNVVSSVSELPQKILISGASNSANNGIKTVIGVLSLVSSAQISVGSSNSHTMTANMVSAILQIGEGGLTTENVSDNTDVNFKRAGFVGDYMLAVGNTDDGKVDIYVDSNDAYTADAITVLTDADGSEVSEFVYYYSSGSLRVADGNHRNLSTPKWYGHIERDQFVYIDPDEDSVSVAATSIASGLYEENNDLAPPSDCKRTASSNVDRTAEFLATGGTGWGLSVEKSSEDGEWEGKDYEFGGTFIYDGNQESLITTFSGGSFTHDDGKKFDINVYANINGSSANGTYSKRISGGRIYIRESESNDEWILFVDIDIKSGARVNLQDEYSPWRLDGAGEFRITSNTTVANYEQAYWVLKSSKPNLDSYESLNGFSPSTKQISFGQLGSGYKTAVVAGMRAFVANVKYDDGSTGAVGANVNFPHFGDRIMFSQIGKYDTFPVHNTIDITKGDGEDYSCLAFYSDRLLAFKQRTLQILNIASPSPSGWFLEQTVPYAGVKYTYSVANTEYGIIWSNKNGAYIFDGSNVTNITDGKIADSGQSVLSGVEWSNFSNSVVGYLPETKQAIFIDQAENAEDALYYDFRYKSWYFGKDAAPNANNAALSSGTTYDAHISNMVNDSTGKLIIAYDTDDVDVNGAGTGKVILTQHQTEEQGHKYYRLQTPDLDFGKPGNKKKVYAIYINYRHSGSTDINDSEIEFMTDNSGTWTSFNATSSVIPQTHSSSKNYRTIKLPLANSVVSPAQSFAFRFNFDALNEDSKFAINDIIIEYRVLTRKAA
jgi:hypothetical protein